jgi:hypothetical protein
MAARSFSTVAEREAEARVALVRVVCVDWVSRAMTVDAAQAWVSQVAEMCSNEHVLVADNGQQAGSTGRYWEGEEDW